MLRCHLATFNAALSVVWTCQTLPLMVINSAMEDCVIRVELKFLPIIGVQDRPDTMLFLTRSDWLCSCKSPSALSKTRTAPHNAASSKYF